MKFLISIGYVNRPDLLQKAVNSIKAYWPSLVIVDNSPGQDLRHETWIPAEITVFEPPVPLTFTQKMNYMQKLAAESECDVVMYMHNDAEAHPDTPEALLSLLASLNRENRRWGLAFTNFDILSAFNMKAVQEVGPWDENLPQYFSDVDYYRRIALAGYEHIWSGLAVTHHNDGMSTMKSDEYRKQVNRVTWPLYQHYYEVKWGMPFRWKVLQPEGNREPFTPPVPVSPPSDVQPPAVQPLAAQPTQAPPADLLNLDLLLQLQIYLNNLINLELILHQSQANYELFLNLELLKQSQANYEKFLSVEPLNQSQANYDLYLDNEPLAQSQLNYDHYLKNEALNQSQTNYNRHLLQDEGLNQSQLNYDQYLQDEALNQSQLNYDQYLQDEALNQSQLNYDQYLQDEGLNQSQLNYDQHLQGEALNQSQTNYDRLLEQEPSLSDLTDEKPSTIKKEETQE